MKPCPPFWMLLVFEMCIFLASKCISSINNSDIQTLRPYLDFPNIILQFVVSLFDILFLPKDTLLMFAKMFWPFLKCPNFKYLAVTQLKNKNSKK